MDEKDKIVITGCTFCRKHFGTVEQFKRHITDDVLPPLLDKLSQAVRELTEGERHDEADIHGQEHNASERQ
jgi:hypothetical protein